MNEIKPQQFWIQNPYNEISTATKVPAYDPEVNPQITEEIHVREITPCANCERLEDQLYHESRKAPEVEYKLGHEIEVLKKQLEMCKEALQEIKLKSGMCVYGTAEMAEQPIEAFRQGSHIAFNECAHIATQALAKLEKE